MLTRRGFLATGSAASAAALLARNRGLAQTAPASANYAVVPPLREFQLGEVTLSDGPEEQQRAQTQSTLAQLEDDSLLRPVRKMGGLPAPGPSLGGWYAEQGWAPSHCLGQWISAMARSYACDAAAGAALKARVATLIQQLQATGPALAVSFRENPFPAYCYDKLLLALMDADALCGTPGAKAFMATLTQAAEPSLPPHALSRNQMCSRPETISARTSCLDENYTLPENQFLAWRYTGDSRYYDRGERFLLNGPFFDRLAAGENALIDQHAYSHLNAVSSGLEAYFATGDPRYLRAVENAFRFVEEQSYPTGGWGPEEAFVDPATDKLEQDLKATHRGFETPCGSYAHFKLSRRLLRLTGDSRYGDSMERVLYNTILGALPLQPDGRAFYYSDYNIFAAKTYFPDRWPCCAGTIAMVAADYRRNIYLTGDDGLYINLYRPSSVAAHGLRVTQSGTYPLGSEALIQITAARPVQTTLHLRIPAWAQDTQVALNGKPLESPIPAGAFLPITREWRNGDRLEITFPLKMRLQPLSSHAPKYAALVRGPLALFGWIPDPDPRPAELLLKAAPIAAQPGMFQVATGGTPLRFSTFDQVPLAQSYSLFQRLA